MRKFLILFLFLQSVTAIALEPIIIYSETRYIKVAASTTNSDGGVVVPNGMTVAFHEIRLNGSDPDAYAKIVWDFGGASEKVLASTKGDINLVLDASLTDNQVTGDGVKTIKIILENNLGTESPDIGGSWCVIEL